MIRVDKKVFEKMELSLRDQCHCGRSNEMLHCPNCGSTDVRVSKKMSLGFQRFSVQTHVPVNIRMLTCRRCAIAFDELASCSCNAPSGGWRREDNIANKFVPPVGQPLNDFQKDLLAGLAKVRPDKARTINERLKEAGPGLLEQVEEHKTTDKVTAKLFEPPVLEEGGGEK